MIIDELEHGRWKVRSCHLVDLQEVIEVEREGLASLHLPRPLGEILGLILLDNLFEPLEHLIPDRRMRSSIDLLESPDTTDLVVLLDRPDGSLSSLFCLVTGLARIQLVFQVQCAMKLGALGVFSIFALT